MNRRQQWQLAALALALAAGAARAQPSETTWTPRETKAAPAVAWEFTTTRADGAARLQMQAGPGATATCESITLRMAGRPVTLTTDGQKVRVIGCAGEGGQRIEASAARVRCGADVLTLEGEAQARFDRKGQAPQTIKGDRVRLNLSTGSLHVEGAGALSNTTPAPVGLDFGFPIAPAAEKDKEQLFNFILGFSR